MIKEILVDIDRDDLLKFRQGCILVDSKAKRGNHRYVYVPFSLSNFEESVVESKLASFLMLENIDTIPSDKSARMICDSIHGMILHENYIFRNILSRKTPYLPITFMQNGSIYTQHPLYMIKVDLNITPTGRLVTSISMDDSGVLFIDPWSDKSRILLVVDDHRIQGITSPDNLSCLKIYDENDIIEDDDKIKDSNDMDFKTFKEKFSEILRGSNDILENNDERQESNDSKCSKRSGCDSKSPSYCGNCGKCNKDNHSSCKKSIIVRVNRLKW